MSLEIVPASSTPAEIIYPAPSSNNPNAEQWADCYQRWLEAVERRRGSKRSRNEYEKIIKLFFSYQNGQYPAMVTGADCQRWVASMQEAGLSKNTVKMRLAAVSSFYAFACSKYEATPGHYLHNFNPASVVQRPHVNAYEKAHGLSVEQARSLLGTCDKSTVIGSRDYALLIFYLYTGRRKIELVNLTWGDIREAGDGSKEYHYVGKGAKASWREIPQPVWQAVKSYLERSGRLSTMQPASPLFVATDVHGQSKDTKLGERTVGQILDRACQRAGLDHIKVHALRHTAAKLRRKAGDDLESVSKFLDHSSVATTIIYLNSIEAKKDDGWKRVANLLSDD